MNTGDVHGYAETNGMGMMVNNQLIDSSNFNSQDRNKTDRNWDDRIAAYTPGFDANLSSGWRGKPVLPNLYRHFIPGRPGPWRQS